ncbi:serine/threonine-protein kinase HT1-like [Forsythia ovata]|uniref:Serine/threonine-protein kinase HT1-like n=1 Tax=Forsythia ovata TaxID=205694 RepID=A0ABD1NVZ5_9LAMI
MEREMGNYIKGLIPNSAQLRDMPAAFEQTEGGEAFKTKKSGNQEGTSHFQGQSSVFEKALVTNGPRRSIGSKDMIFRADKIDLKSLDIQLENHFSGAWSRNVEN